MLNIIAFALLQIASPTTKAVTSANLVSAQTTRYTTMAEHGSGGWSGLTAVYHGSGGWSGVASAEHGSGGW
ncbi:hypothetical protein, partial [uncultured Hymenobacter sp.]|uniref:hypothetical protein n=1 Tax=uncultured Hymenobacter sp. TaxID=170016 RepID=UPI0035CA9DE5